MRGTIYVFMSVLLLTFVGCNNNEDVSLIENQTTNLQQDQLIDSEKKTIEQPETILNPQELMELQDMVSEIEIKLPKEVQNPQTAQRIPIGVGGTDLVLKTTDILIGRTYKAGSITVELSPDRLNLIVTYKTNRCWTLRNTNLYLGDKLGIPLTRYGYPNYTKFPYRERHTNTRINEYSYTIPLSDLRGVECITVAAHAKLGIYYRGWCWIYSGWGDGINFEGTRCPAFYFSLCQNDGGDDDDPIDTH